MIWCGTKSTYGVISVGDRQCCQGQNNLHTDNVVDILNRDYLLGLWSFWQRGLFWKKVSPLPGWPDQILAKPILKNCRTFCTSWLLMNCNESLYMSDMRLLKWPPLELTFVDAATFTLSYCPPNSARHAINSLIIISWLFHLRDYSILYKRLET